MMRRTKQNYGMDCIGILRQFDIGFGRSLRRIIISGMGDNQNPRLFVADPGRKIKIMLNFLIKLTGFGRVEKTGDRRAA